MISNNGFRSRIIDSDEETSVSSGPRHHQHSSKFNTRFGDSDDEVSIQNSGRNSSAFGSPVQAPPKSSKSPVNYDDRIVSLRPKPEEEKTRKVW